MDLIVGVDFRWVLFICLLCRVLSGRILATS